MNQNPLENLTLQPFRIWMTWRVCFSYLWLIRGFICATPCSHQFKMQKSAPFFYHFILLCLWRSPLKSYCNTQSAFFPSFQIHGYCNNTHLFYEEGFLQVFYSILRISSLIFSSHNSDHSQRLLPVPSLHLSQQAAPWCIPLQTSSLWSRQFVLRLGWNMGFLCSHMNICFKFPSQERQEAN